MIGSPKFSAVAWARRQEEREQKGIEREREVLRRMEASIERAEKARIRLGLWALFWQRTGTEPATQLSAEYETYCRTCDGEATLEDGWCDDCEGTGLCEPEGDE